MFAHTISKTLTAGVLAVTMAFTVVVPTTASARTSEENALAGIIALMFLGAVIHNSRNNDDRAAPDHTAAPVRERQQRGWRVLPAQCLTTINTRRGDNVRLFTQRCLNNNYRFTNRLPQECHVRVRTDSGERRQGYAARCMRNAGFRTNRR